MPYKNEEDHRKNAKRYYGNHRESEIERTKQYYHDHREQELERMKQRYINKGKEELFRKKYDLSLKDWEGLWYAQDGRCAICDEFFSPVQKICVDHDHETGEVRGLLCNECNIGLGHFNNIKIVKNAIEYLNT